VTTHDFLAKITQISAFFAFPNFRKMDKFAFSIERAKTKSALASDPLTRGSAALDPAAGPYLSQTPVIGSRYRARHMEQCPLDISGRRCHLLFLGGNLSFVEHVK